MNIQTITILMAFIYSHLYEMSCIFVENMNLFEYRVGATPGNTDEIIELQNILHMYFLNMKKKNPSSVLISPKCFE